MLKERKYSPAGTVSSIPQTIKSIVRDFPTAHHLGFLLAVRNFKAKYRQSLLGMFWAFLIPLSTSVVWIILNKQRIVNFGNLPCSYPVFVIIGTTIWQVFTASVLGPLQSVNANRSILSKVNFPRESVLVTSFYEIVLTVIIGFIIIGGVLILTGTPITFGAFYIIPGILTLMLIGMTISLLLLPISLLYTDIGFALPSALQFLMYLTPVVYPKPLFTQFQALFNYNPVGIVLQFTRNEILGIHSDVTFITIAIILGITFLLFLFTILLYRITLEVLIERMGS